MLSNFTPSVSSHWHAIEKYSWATAPGLKGTTALGMQFCFATGYIWMSSCRFHCPHFYWLPAYIWNTAFNTVQAVFQTWHLKHYPPTVHYCPWTNTMAFTAQTPQLVHLTHLNAGPLGNELPEIVDIFIFKLKWLNPKFISNPLEETFAVFSFKHMSLLSARLE